MSFVIRIPVTLYQSMEVDLLRPHIFAAERVGFLFGRHKNGVILATGYQPISEEHYIKDDSVGVRFSGSAIREAMLRVLQKKLCAFHIHYHDFSTGDLPSFSRVDLESLQEVIPGFHGANSQAPHGALVLSPEGGSGLVWPSPGKAPICIDISVVGFPLKIWRTRYE